MTAVRFQVTHGGANLATEAHGGGYPVAFLHAGVADRRMWRHQIIHLAGRWRTIAYDRRGFGETVCGDDVFAHVDDLAAVLDHCRAPSAVLVGCSQGGRIAIDFALAHPERVDALVLVAPAISGAPDVEQALPADVAKKIEALEAAEADEDVDRVNALEANLWLDGPGMPDGRVGGAARALLLDMNGIALRHRALHGELEPPPAYERLNELTMPALVVWGSLDFPHVQRHCRHLTATLRDATSAELEGVAHLPSLEQPDRLNALLEGFLCDRPPGRAPDDTRPRVTAAAFREIMNDRKRTTTEGGEDG